MVVYPCVEVKSVEADASLPEGDLCQVWTYVALKDSVAYAEISRSLGGTQETGEQHRVHRRNCPAKLRPATSL
jgi:hypothetical protein